VLLFCVASTCSKSASSRDPHSAYHVWERRANSISIWLHLIAKASKLLLLAAGVRYRRRERNPRTTTSQYNAYTAGAGDFSDDVAFGAQFGVILDSLSITEQMEVQPFVSEVCYSRCRHHDTVNCMPNQRKDVHGGIYDQRTVYAHDYRRNSDFVATPRICKQTYSRDWRPDRRFRRRQLRIFVRCASATRFRNLKLSKTFRAIRRPCGRNRSNSV